MAEKKGLYDSVKELSSLQMLYEVQQRVARMRLQLRLWMLMKDFFQLLDDIANLPSNFSESVLKERDEEPYLEVERGSAYYFQDVKEKIVELFVEATQVSEMEFPDKLESSLDDLSAQLREHKEQLKASASAAKNFDKIFAGDSPLLKGLAGLDIKAVDAEGKENM